jgi:hypothetical protein
LHSANPWSPPKSRGPKPAAQTEGNAILGGTLAAAEWVILVTSLDAKAWPSAAANSRSNRTEAASAAEIGFVQEANTDVNIFQSS